MIAYPMSTGLNFDEILRVIDSLQLTASHKVSTPVNWEPGEDVIISGTISDEAAKKTYPDGWRAPRPYVRFEGDARGGVANRGFGKGGLAAGAGCKVQTDARSGAGGGRHLAGY